MIGIEVNYKGIAAVISYHHRRNVWQGTAAFGRAARQSYGDALIFWYDNILPLHFVKGAERRYAHQKRKKPYLKLKRRLAKGEPTRGRHGDLIRGRHARVIKGGEVDIVRSGQTERMATRGVYYVVTQPRYGILTFNVPHYITQRSRTGRPRQDQELKTVTPGEIQRISSVAGKSFFTTLKEEARRAPARKFRPR